MNVAVCIPWTGGDKWRTQAFRACVDWWHVNGFPVFVAGNQRQPRSSQWPNRAAARNAAIRDALNTTVDAILLADADTEVPGDQVRAAADLATMTGRVVYPYDDFQKVNRQMTERFLRPPRPDDWQVQVQRGVRHVNPCSGALVVPRELVVGVGGFDERYTAWGCEDRCFLLAAEAFYGPHRRVTGPAWHWWHPRAADKGVLNTRGYESQRDLARRYVAAAGYDDVGWPVNGWPKTGPASIPGPADQKAMYAILTEPGGPLAR